MRALFVVFCASVLLLSADHGISRAGVEAGARTTSMELLVFEHPDCTYCPIFRQDVGPPAAIRYQLDSVGPDRGHRVLRGRQ